MTVTYNYDSNPLFPELPGLSVITPSTLVDQRPSDLRPPARRHRHAGDTGEPVGDDVTSAARPSSSTAITMVLLLWGGAMGVDLGFSVGRLRAAQAIADTGALDMTRYINIADGHINDGQRASTIT